ncbi:MAG: carbonic anhydrase [Cyanobacteria bacterium CRU_2_1]|nr:carbonic anhydrase [Cyanobacteria bacterium RU_5_0]NJR60469.1 carbonic anhydrase [Cyanobacteria bacterium CRU_2_1]
MHRRSLLKYMSMGTAGAVFSFSFPSLQAAIASETEAEWGYGMDDGPQLWSELSPDFSICTAGQQQSPINLQGAISSDLVEVQIGYQEIPLRLVNNGHTIQVNADPGNPITLDNQTFDLLQFHFHSPSEHSHNGQSYSMEVHFVHRNERGELAVLGVFMQEGQKNEALQLIWDAIPAEAGPEQAIAEVKVQLNQLFPVDRSFYRYFGSLTTPPCSEVVNWIVYQQPIEVSREQVEKFVEIFPGNARPIQPLNRRFLLQSD